MEIAFCSWSTKTLYAMKANPSLLKLKPQKKSNDIKVNYF
jgi:hypothetical protein